MNHPPRRLLAILAHPDDETLGMGGTLCKYAAEGVETFLITATRGERGRFGKEGVSPGMKVVGETRERELRKAASLLGIGEVTFLDYLDGDLDQVPPVEAIPAIARHIRRIKPGVVVTFGPEGAYGHPDHIAISQFTTGALIKAADPLFDPNDDQPHAVSKLYYMAWPPEKWDAYQAALKELAITVDGQKRLATPYPGWAITTRLNARQHWQRVWEAVQCHETQMSVYEKLASLSAEQHQTLWGDQEFYRVYSTVNGGRQLETDLFEGFSF